MVTRFYKHKIENLVCVDKIVTVHYLEYTKDFAFPGESHDFWEMVYIDKGKVLCARGENKEFVMQSGNALFHKPNEFHKIRADGISGANVVVVSFSAKSAAMGALSDGIFTFDGKERELIGEIIDESENTFVMPGFNPYIKKLELRQNPPIGGLQMIKICLEKLLIILLRSKSGDGQKNVFLQSGIGGTLAAAVAEYLQKNVYKKITLEQICKEFYYGKTYLCTEFKKSTGKTIFEYFNMLKIQEAKQLVRGRELSFSQIAENLGFNSYSYFVKLFKTQVGCSPNEYRELIKA